MQTCPDCGCRVYSLGCVNCNEDAYIQQQEATFEGFSSGAKWPSSADLLTLSQPPRVPAREETDKDTRTPPSTVRGTHIHAATDTKG